MSPHPPRGQDILLPPSSLHALAKAAAVAPPDGEAILLRAGLEVGHSILLQLSEDRADVSQGDFWDRLHRHLARRGLGSIRHRRIHPGIGVLESAGVAELGGEHGEGEGPPFVPFTTGVLRGVLAAAAGRPVDLRLLGGASGASGCRWVFGSPAALDALEAALGAGRTLEDAVAHL